MGEEKMYTYEEIHGSTMEASKARYEMVGCFYKTLLEELGREKADELTSKAYFKYGHLKHEGVKVIPGDLENICKTYNSGEHTFYKNKDFKIPYEVVNDKKAVIRWCMEGECGGLDWFMEAGLTREQAGDLCACACSGDIGYADKCNLDAHFTQTVGDGSPFCEFVVTRRK
jgi:hypothetical protein